MFHTDFQYRMVDASLLLYLFMCLIMLVQKAPGKISVCMAEAFVTNTEEQILQCAF